TPNLRHAVADWGQGTGGGRSNGVIVGNPNLKPEKSINYEVGLGYVSDDGYQASITTYFTRFRDKIQTQYLCRGDSGSAACTANGVGGFDFVQTRFNVDKADVKGLELTETIPFTEQLALTSSYSWTDSEQKSGQ